jgi:DNA primase
MAWPDSFVEEVRHAADIVRVISEHMALKKTGSSWKGLCPFHKEKTPSFNVRAEPPIFHCFGCGEGGDVFKFLMLHERMSFPEAVLSLAQRFGIPVPEGHREPGPDRKQREQLLELLEAAAQHYAHDLWKGPGTRAREYLLGRGFEKTTLERIRAGAAIDSWDNLLLTLGRRFPKTALVAAGLCLERKDHSGHYDRFRNRVVFPILNERGQVVGFGARSLDASEPKYLNSPETAVYQKGSALYGLSWAKEAARRERRLVLMEGYLDVARAIEKDVHEAVATCGTALTPGHARLMRRFADEVFVNFDQDEAGQRAALKGLEVLREEGLSVRVVELPGGHDPDTFLKEHGAEAFRQRLTEAPVHMEWLIRRAAERHAVDSPPGKAAFLKSLLPALVAVESAVERSAWLGRVTEVGRLDPAAAEDELARALGKRSPTAPRPPLPRSDRELLPAERLLLGLVLKGAEGAAAALAELREEDVAALRSRELLRAARDLHLGHHQVTAAALEGALPGEEQRRMLREIALDEPPPEAALPLECVAELRRLMRKRRLAEIQRELASAPEGAVEDLLQEMQTLSRQMADL